MLTGDQYRESLRDGRRLYFEGERVDDIESHPVLGDCVDRVAAEYDQAYLPGDDVRSPLMESPRSADDLRKRIPQLDDQGILAGATYLSLMTLITAAGRINTTDPEQAETILAYVDDAQRRDIRIPQCITDAKGDRSLSPSKQPDPDSYVRVVDRTSDGVVIRGAKLHISAASLGHDLMVIPTKAMKPGEEDYAIACMVPVASDGVTIVNSSAAPRGTDPRDHPIASEMHFPEGFVIFDDVFVPRERVLLDGATAQASVFAHSLGLWERLSGLSKFAKEADLLTGLGLLVAEANGLDKVSHIKEKLSDMMIHATLIRASLEAAITHTTIDELGFAVPDELYTNAGKYYGAANYGMLIRHLHDIAGGSVMTVPSAADFDNPDTGPALRKYMTGARGTGDERAAIFRVLRDLTADSYGGWKLVTSIQAGGGLYAQRIVTRNHYDADGAKRLAQKYVDRARADLA